MQLSTLLTAFAALPLILAAPNAPYPFEGFKGRRTPNHRYSSLSTYKKPYCPPQPAPESIQREIFSAFIHTLYGEKNVTDAFENYVAVDLIEHDPFDSQGRAPNEAKLLAIVPFVPSKVLRSSFDNNIGLAHVRIDSATEPEPIALADIYRMNGTCIVEHWDITQSRPANATNPIAMF